jgi:hypothetical protein
MGKVKNSVILSVIQHRLNPLDSTCANFTELSPSWEVTSHAATQVLPNISWYPKIHYHMTLLYLYCTCFCSLHALACLDPSKSSTRTYCWTIHVNSCSEVNCHFSCPTVTVRRTMDDTYVPTYNHFHFSNWCLHASLPALSTNVWYLLTSQERRKPYNEELHGLYSLPSIIRMRCVLTAVSDGIMIFWSMNMSNSVDRFWKQHIPMKCWFLLNYKVSHCRRL